MGFPSDLIGKKAAEFQPAQRESLGMGTMLAGVGILFLAAGVAGFFVGFAAFVGVRTFAAFMTRFPGA